MSKGESVEPVYLPGRPALVHQWRWRAVLLTTGMGACGALAAALVRLAFRGLQWFLTGSAADAPEAAAHLPPGRRLVTPILGAVLASVVLVLRRRRAHRLGREPRPYVEYVEAVRHKRGQIPLLPNAWRTLSAAFSVSSGAAVGREGSMIQFAAAITSVLGRLRILQSAEEVAPLSFVVACGVAGGVTAAYNAPLASTFFAAEIVLGLPAWQELPLLGLASGAGWLVSGAILGRARLYPAPVGLAWNASLGWLPALALLAGLLGPLYQSLLHSLGKLRRLPAALVWGGAVVGLCSVRDPRTWGNGDFGLRSALGMTGLPGVAGGVRGLGSVLVLRLLATLSCVWTGTVGGVFTPTLFAGGALGALLSHALPGEAGRLWAIAGMSFLMAAVTHAPLMAACMAVELTGNWHLLPVLVPLNLLSWRLARRLSPRAMYAIASQAPAEHPAPGQRPAAR